MAERVRELRRRQGMTQEELAEAAGLSLAVVKKVEQGCDVRMWTLRRIARAFGAAAVTLADLDEPEPAEETTTDDRGLAALRSAIHPPVGMTGRPLRGSAEERDPDLAGLSRAAGQAAVAYHADRYDDLAAMMPALVRCAHRHVEAYESGAEHREAVRLRAGVTGLAGRYLLQVRVHDLALIALHTSLTDAARVGDVPLAAAAVTGQAWAMVFQGRLEEVERLCARAAEEIDAVLSVAPLDQLSCWGRLLAQAGEAACCGGRPEDAGSAR